MSTSPKPDPMLLAQLRWLIGLRWVAGGMVLVGGGVLGGELAWYPQAWPEIMAVGAGVLAYNTALWAWLARRRPRHGDGALLAWAQILPDLAALALLALWTGGAQSPLLGLFVLHMVFASLLLEQRQAYSAALAAVALLALGLLVSDQLPETRSEQLLVLGWGLTLLLTVFLTNHIVSALRRHRLRLLARNQRVRQLLERLRRQQGLLIQHEKTVALGQMAAGVAHEIANPLANLDSVLQLAQRRGQPPSDQDVAVLRQQVQRIRQTVQQLTGFAHPTEFTWQVMSIRDLVETGLEMVRFDRRRRSIDIQREYAATLCQVRIQPHAMQQVLINLLLNALDAVSEVAAPRISVGTYCRDGTCCIWVRDNGAGIAPEHLPHLFEPFFTTKPVGKGTGLGLAISQNLVRNQGGRIELTSQPGQGTTATIYLPAQSPGPASPTSPTVSAPRQTP